MCSPAEFFSNTTLLNRAMAPSPRDTAPAPFWAELLTNSQLLNSTWDEIEVESKGRWVS